MGILLLKRLTKHRIYLMDLLSSLTYLLLNLKLEVLLL